ncbi:hypothetical protein HYDPIDRAFT_109949 [Hydnomerulius pinastri MD-312]|nr:hypothetical protein HYDPIDRAFT_109949 [Hydnomerulius pinastri MD-312]
MYQSPSQTPPHARLSMPNTSQHTPVRSPKGIPTALHIVLSFSPDLSKPNLGQRVSGSWEITRSPTP